MTKFQKWLLVAIVMYMIADLGGGFGIWFTLFGYYGLFMILFVTVFS